MWDKEGAGAGYCSSVSWRLAQGSRWSVYRGASGSFHPSQYEPACTTKLQVTSGHLGQKINSSPCFKIEIKLKLRTKMYMLKFAAGFDAPFPPLFLSPRHLPKCTKENKHLYLSHFLLLLYILTSAALLGPNTDAAEGSRHKKVGKKQMI